MNQHNTDAMIQDQTAFKRHLFYYQGMLQVSTQQQEMSYVSESIRALQQLIFFNTHSQILINKLLRLHKDILLAIATDQQCYHFNIFEHLLSSLNCIHKVANDGNYNEQELTLSIHELENVSLSHSLQTTNDQ